MTKRIEIEHGTCNYTSSFSPCFSSLPSGTATPTPASPKRGKGQNDAAPVGLSLWLTNVSFRYACRAELC